jgi:hypothetical protein
VAYLVCEEDRVIVPELQNSFIVAMESRMGETRVDRHSVKSGHYINASQPAVMAEVIRRAVWNTGWEEVQGSSNFLSRR